jgi:drug/metabolite transporter (DMT)-like permease
MNLTNLEEAIQKEKKSRIKWGYLWGIIGAIMWGGMYIPSVVVWKLPDYSNPIFPGGVGNIFLALIAICFGSSLMKVLVTLFYWDLGEGKLSDVPKALTHWKISKVLLLSSILAGPLGVAGYNLAVGLSGGSFAAAASLLAGVFSGLACNIFLKEKLSRNAIIGMLVIVLGGVFIFNPYALIDELATNKGSLAYIGYLGGLISAIFWGVEGAFVSKVTDFYDYSMSMTCRAIFEFLGWIFIMIPIVSLFYGLDSVLAVMAHVYIHPAFWIWEVFYVFTGFSSYVGMYRSFPLIGGGRGMTMVMLYVIPGFIMLSVFLGEIIHWWIIVGAILSIGGSAFMYLKGSSELESGTRALEEDSCDSCLIVAEEVF